MLGAMPAHSTSGAVSRSARRHGRSGSAARARPSRTAAIQQKLLSWYRVAARDLPWRHTRDPYAIWVSEVILQQTRVETGRRYFGPFLAAFPSLERLAQAREQTVLKAWEGLGYYRRARHLHQAARQAMQRFGGMPPSYGEFRSLPGVGAYTAAAVWAIAHGQPHLPIDGNIRRVLSRLFDIDSLRDAAYLPAGEPLLRGLARSQIPSLVQGLMELGALICLPREPRCPLCPLLRHCLARLRATLPFRPPRTPRRPTPHHEVVVAYLQDGRGRVLLTQRSAGGLLGGLWELPGGKVEPGETLVEALCRELGEELGLAAVEVEQARGSVSHAYSHFSVRLHLFDAHARGRLGPLNGPAAARWVRADRIAEHPIPRGTQKALALRERSAPRPVNGES